MDINWPASFAQTEKFEGWHLFSNDPYDPGGATYDGVTQAVYDAYRRLKGLVTQSVHLMSDAECEDIMKTQYWDRSNCGQMWDGLDALIYDIAVNSGVSRGIRFLQQAVGVPVDGIYGLHTHDAMMRVNDRAALITKIAALRSSFWHALSTWWRYGRGWTSRGDAEAKFALSLLAAVTPTS